MDLGTGTDAITFAPNTLVAARLGMTLKSEAINVGAGATLSTRAAKGHLLTANSTANSGNMTLEGEQITVGVGGRLLTPRTR